jgi:ABC-type phosphate transport system substrate-binding protein
MSAFKRKPGRASLRGALVAGATAGALLLAGLGAGTASAAPGCPEKGLTIEGQGSSLQKTAQGIWTSGYNGICTTGPVAKYTATSSGSALKEWNYDLVRGSINTKIQFLGTDDAPTAGQITNIKSTAGGATTEIIPVTQAAIAIVVNPPAECTLTQIKRAELEKVFRGETTTWSGITTASGAGCTGNIKRVVRSDSSGTSYQLKHYLFSVSGSNLPCLTTTTWANLQTPANNTVWPVNTGSCSSPTLSPVVKSKASGTGAEGTGSGGGDEVKTVNTTGGSIGYAALADVENNKTGGTHFVEVQNGTSGGSPTYASPLKATKMSNCEKTPYTVPMAAREAGTNTDVDWSGVYPTSTTTINYPICTLTWDVAFKGYSSAGFAAGTGKVVKDYLSYVVNEGATGVTGSYYDALPNTGIDSTDVFAAAKRAAALVE